VWQALHEELRGRGLVVMTVALDASPDDARRGLDPMGPSFRAMRSEWTQAGHRYYRPLDT
jgi:hypothetical protein